MTERQHLFDRLVAQPDALPEHDDSDAIATSVLYLGSPEATASLGHDAYWPKWHSPWWHMLTLHEIGQTKTIPEGAIQSMVEALQRLPIKFFPIHPYEVTPETDLVWDATCHCAAGSIYAVLLAWGVPVDEELPWLRTWLSRYQMEDGGMSCDPYAYLVEDQCPSSMVGTIAPFEALLMHPPSAWSAKEQTHLRHAANFLLERELHLGSASLYNAEESVSAATWTRLCFPRLYFYDVLRGLEAVLTYAEKTDFEIPIDTIETVVEGLLDLSPDGALRTQRLSYANVGTRQRGTDGEWKQSPTASLFPLLVATAEPGRVSPYLTQRWTSCKAKLRVHLSAQQQPSTP